MSLHRFVSVGECMIEMSGGDAGAYQMGFAGDTLNTAWYARAGLSKDWQVDYLSAIGDDIYSHKMRAFLEANEIGTTHLRQISNKRPGLYMIHQADGDRHFTYWRDQSAARCLADAPEALASGFDGADLIYFSGITLAILGEAGRANLYQALFDARVKGSKVAFDPNLRPALWPDAKSMADEIVIACNHVDFALPTFDDDADLFGDADVDACAARYDGYGVPEVIVKNGSQDAMIATELDRIIVPAQKVDNVVDATGAGDSFGGAYLAARLMGKDLAEAAAQAHAQAAAVIQNQGALISRDKL
ncbi:sugar kinase [bacterium]|nr:sugar kinase [bacterium]